MGTTDQGPPLVVCDAGPLIHLDELDALGLLVDFAEVLVPDAVWREVERHRPRALTHPGVTLQRITPMMAVTPELEALMSDSPHEVHLALAEFVAANCPKPNANSKAMLSAVRCRIT